MKNFRKVLVLGMDLGADGSYGGRPLCAIAVYLPYKEKGWNFCK